jgi:ABC-type multidrug transport system fused ATPase/permease subunit
MRVMGFDRYLEDKWRDLHNETRDELLALEKKDAAAILLCDALRIIAYGVAICLTLWLAVRGDVTIGVFGACTGAFYTLQQHTGALMVRIGEFSECQPFVRDYWSFLDLPDEPDGALGAGSFKDGIRLDDVSFSYPNAETEVLANISLYLRKGEKVALVGENGCGKTTLVKALTGLYPPKSGRVLWDGKPVADCRREDLFRNISAVAQEFVSWQLSLRENIALSDPSRADDDAGMRKALALAGADGLGDLDMMLGLEFGGAELSGGMWQKLAIARALFKESEFMILDEPTASLDPMIENEILTTFLKAAEDKTALIISHRVGICTQVDRVIVMRDGRVVETGSHGELLAAGGAYARLFTAQAQWYR